MDNPFIEGMYREPRPEPPFDEGRIEEHNRIVKSFEGPQGQADARAAFDFWDAEFNRLKTGDSHRMREIAAGLAGVSEPWMKDVGYLTEDDRNDMMHFRSQEQADPKLEDLRAKLWDRQQNEAQALAEKQSAEQIRLGPSQQLADEHRRERESQIEAFASERARYIGEYHEGKRIAEDLEERERQHGREHDPSKDLSR